MMLIQLKRRSAPIAALTLATFVFATVAPVRALAQQTTDLPSSTAGSAPQISGVVADDSTSSAGSLWTGPSAASPQPADSDDTASGTYREPDIDARNIIQRVDPSAPTSDEDVELAPAPEDATADNVALPGGADKSGVTSSSISVPTGAGTITGMGESFSTQLSTGVATFSVPFSLPKARGAAQPALALSYSSGGGYGVAGVGWQVGVPFIARQTDRGVPRYRNDSSTFNPDQDRFVFNGGQELVPICVVTSGGGCPGKLLAAGAGSDEIMPSWSAGWRYFRPRVEGSFLRFFWHPNKQTWRVQDKSGVSMELGVPLDGSGYSGALERNPENQEEIYRWHLVRQYDLQGTANPAAGNPAPVNVVVYRYREDGGTAYLSDIFDTTPADDKFTVDTSKYAHHTRLEYEQRADTTVSYRSGWPMQQRLRLKRVDVTSKTTVDGVGGPRKTVRRYHLAYDATWHASLLASVTIEGRCWPLENWAHGEGPDGKLPESTGCGKLPPMTFQYSHVSPFTSKGAAVAPPLVGYEGFDERVQTVPGSPPHSIDEQLTDFFDINSDGLPDVLVTAPGLYGSGHGVFFNGAGARPGAFGSAQSMAVLGVLGATAADITLKNLNVNPLDLDGDATVDLLHMPAFKTWAIYQPVRLTSGWAWQGRSVTSATNQSSKIDFGRDSSEIRTLDVNFDGLVDVVVMTGTEVQTFFSLARYPGGDGQFGSAAFTGSGTAAISTDPVRTCVPWSATPVHFSDADIKLADMNGDGITDIVRLRQGDVRYWPGRGNGMWGTGRRDDCTAGTFGANRDLAMTSSPTFSDIQGDSLRLDDVNGDGLADLVQVRYNEVDVWLNVDGVSWTKRHIIGGTPYSPSYAQRVRLVDINGSGTRDILWGDSRNYRYIDLDGGSRPALLVSVSNGLGKTTSFEYGTSTSEMLAAEGGGPCVTNAVGADFGRAWCRKAPTIVHLVKKVTERDNLAQVAPVTTLPIRDGAYVTEYKYRDAVYDGQQREFRGFRHAQVKRIGDANSPTDITESSFLLGECLDENDDDNFDPCAVSEAWRDNPREALKGLPYLTEQYDPASGMYLFTEHQHYTLRELYKGLDGRVVRHAFAGDQNKLLYDNVAPANPPPTAQFGAVDVELGSAGIVHQTVDVVPVRNVTGVATHLLHGNQVDWFGNKVVDYALGCIAACPSGVADQAIYTLTFAGLSDEGPQGPASGSGWAWRPTYSSVIGSEDPNLSRNVQEMGYDWNGNQILVNGTSSGAINVDRATGGAVAPPDAITTSATTYTLLGEKAYDEFGNLIKDVVPNSPSNQYGQTSDYSRSRCLETTYTSDYRDLPIIERSYRNGCQTANADYLQRVVSYDHGNALVTYSEDLHLAGEVGPPTKFEYDGFGRLKRIFRPQPNGSAGTVASLSVDYYLPDATGLPLSALITQSQDGITTADSQYRQTVSYVDGLGRTLVTANEADVPTGDVGAQIISGLVAYDAKGALERKYIDVWESAPAVQYARQRYDAFGRVIEKFDIDNSTKTLRSVYHALSADHYDAEDDKSGGTHYGTYATEVQDGHGRTVSTIERFKEAGGPIKARETRTTYLSTGEPTIIRRVHPDTPGSGDVVRWMLYDTRGRMVLNVEPNTTQGFFVPTSYPPTIPGTLKAWRYVYNYAGELVATSDARGCGVNFLYDRLGRLATEDYSPCLSTQAAYSAPNSGAGTGFEVFYQYDSGAPSVAGIPAAPFGINEPFARGRLVAVHDRAASSWTNYDARGRVVAAGRYIAKPGTPSNSFSSRYAPRSYMRTVEYDAADRELKATTGATRPELQGSTVLVNGMTSTSAIEMFYSQRGVVHAVGGSYAGLIDNIRRHPDGLIDEILYGANTHPTSPMPVARTHFEYSPRRWLQAAQTTRDTPPYWSSPPANYLPAPNPDVNLQPSFQLILQDDSYDYDRVGNPISIVDNRPANQWPAGAKPVSRSMVYDDLYRLASIGYTQTGGADTWTAPFAAENGTDTTMQDPRRAKPTPQVSFTQRVQWQTFAYDWLGNTKDTRDDAAGFYDRSLGVVDNNTAGNKPYQLSNAHNIPAGTREGELQTLYDTAGNLTRLRVRRKGPCVGGSNCSMWMAYDWDEVGRLVRARRWDYGYNQLPNVTANIPGGSPAVDLKYAYDGSDARVLKTAVVGTAERHTVYIFPSLELRRAQWITTGTPDYERTAYTEVAYLLANGVRVGRLNYDDTDVPTLAGNRLHVFLEIDDHLGSTSIVIDQATGELVERGTYMAYGAVDSDYRHSRWKGFREDYRFTDKEEDVEVGLQYFGKRFYSPGLNRWTSPDPLPLHNPAEGDLNLYAYVSGSVLKNIDPLGLDITVEETTVKDAHENVPGAYPSKVASDKEGAPNYEGVEEDNTKILGSVDPTGKRNQWEVNVKAGLQPEIYYDKGVDLDKRDPGYDYNRSTREHEFEHAAIDVVIMDELKNLLKDAGIQYKFAEKDEKKAHQKGQKIVAKITEIYNSVEEYVQERVNHAALRREGGGEGRDGVKSHAEVAAMKQRALRAGVPEKSLRALVTKAEAGRAAGSAEAQSRVTNGSAVPSKGVPSKKP